MIELKRVPVLRTLVPFTAGSLLGIHTVVATEILTVWIINLTCWICLALVFRMMKRNPVLFSGVFCLTAFLCFMATGYGTGLLVRPRDPGLPLDQKVLVRGSVLEEASPANRSWVTSMHLRLVAAGDSVIVTNTVVRLYLDMPSDSVLPAPGESWQFFGYLHAIKNSGNPGSPDYEKILRRRNCWYRFYADDLPAVNCAGRKGEDRKLSKADIRQAIADRWEGEPEELSLLKAVCLGDRSDLTPAMEHDFSRAGGMHILAVSGLHVGLIWWVLCHALSFLVRITGREMFRTLLILVILWTYAWVTGFSSSVCRAVTMFSLLSAGRLLDQRSSTLNGILVSAFLLLVLDPSRILDVGFQLSYVAVLGIITIQPCFRRLFRVRHRLLRWILDATGVSIAAQLATGPLVAFYFHQIPVYGILTNLVAVPLLSCIITVFVISSPFLATGSCTWLFNGLLTNLGALLNHTMAFIGSFPGSVIPGLQPGAMDVWFMLVFFLLAVCILHDRRNLFRYLLLAHLVVITGRTTLDRYQTIHSAEFVAAHFYGGSLLIFREGYRVDYYMWSGDPVVSGRMRAYMDNAWGNRCYRHAAVSIEDSSIGNGLITACHPLCRGAWQVGNDRVRGLVLSGVFDPVKQQVLSEGDWDFILLSGEPRFISTINKGFFSRCDLIVDGSGRPWYPEKLNLPPGTVYLTGQQGAYVKRW